MRNRLILAVLVAVVLSFAVVAWAVNPSGKATWRADELPILGKDLNELRQRPILTPSTTVSGANTTTIPVTHGLVQIDSGTGSTAYTLSIAAGVAGQEITIFNNGASATSGIATISSGKIGRIIYVGSAWRLIADE